MFKAVAAFFAALLLAAPARADFGDCTEAGYLGRFPEAPTAETILCVELFRFTHATPEGERHIRAISDVAADWAIPPAVAEGVERGAREAAAAFPGLGSYAIDDVTLLLLDDLSSWEDGDREIAAITDGRRDAAGTRPGECLVTVYGLSSSATPEEIAVTTAHEIFHCLQYASLSSAQMGTYGAGGDWWIEGAAEYFPAYAVSGSEPYTGREAMFDDAVLAGTALNDMAHGAAPFFFWLGETRGIEELMPFQRAMADGGGAAAQQAAMRGVLDDRAWLDFAQAYADANIARPGGGLLALTPTLREFLTISAPGPQRITLDPFTLLYGVADYDCGTWGNRLRPETANLSVQPDGTTGWGTWPEEIEAEEGRPATYRFVAMSTETGPLDATLEVERRRACAPCAGSDRVDACLAGTWQMTGGGPVEWMRAQGIPITRAAEGPRIVTFRSDGAYGTEPLGIEIEIRDEDMIGQGTGFVTVASGRWSAVEGTLNICQDAGGMSGTVTVTDRHGTRSGPVSQPSAGSAISMSYSCAGGTLSTAMAFPGLPEMVTSYTKIAEEVPPAPP